MVVGSVLWCFWAEPGQAPGAKIQPPPYLRKVEYCPLGKSLGLNDTNLFNKLDLNNLLNASDRRMLSDYFQFSLKRLMQ